MSDEQSVTSNSFDDGYHTASPISLSNTSPITGGFDGDSRQFTSVSHKQGHTFGRTAVKGGQVQLGDIYRTHNTYNTYRTSPAGSDLFNKDRPVYIIPRKASPYFTGRATHLEQTRTELIRSLTGVHGHKIVVVDGLGGSGKTQFCLRFCEEYRMKLVWMLSIEILSS